jgi:hypothetical protein
MCEKSPNLVTLIIKKLKICIKNILTILSNNHRKHSQGCQMVYFQTKNPNLGKIFRPLD